MASPFPASYGRTAAPNQHQAPQLPLPSSSPSLSGTSSSHVSPHVSPSRVSPSCDGTMSDAVGSSRPAAPCSHPKAASRKPKSTDSRSSASQPVKRRMRMITSCLECRRRKLRCDKSHPCINCTRLTRSCIYLGPKLDAAGRVKLTEIKEQFGSLERQLERDVAGGAESSSLPPSADPQTMLADYVERGDNDDGDLETTPMVALDIAYDSHADPDGAAGDMIDLGILVGRMRITERIGGLNRPRISEEIQAGLSAPSSTAPASSLGLDSAIPDFLKPTDAYIPPTSGSFFGHSGDSSLLTYLLSEQAGSRLFERYMASVHPIARCLHGPTFELQYTRFWTDIRNGIEPRASTQALVFACWFSAAVSLEPAATMELFGLEKAALVDNMKLGTETALSRANFLRTTSIETMQAFVMYLIPLCRAEVSRAHSVLVGAAVRMAECMGLHRDGEAYGLSPLETLTRRLLWHQLCFLDIRTCEAQGPRPAIRRDEYDTKLPLNCEEFLFNASATAPPHPADCWTSALLPLIRFDINEMMRVIWSDRRKLEARKTTLSTVLNKIENFRRCMRQKYDRLLHDDVPIQLYAKLVMNLLLYRLHAMVLHPYHVNTANPMPRRLISVLVMSGIMMVEIARELETNPLFQDWAWYLGAYQQYQIALLLATEIYYRPANTEAPRIWACLDYVFQLDPAAGPDEKGRAILTEIMAKTGVYQSRRKMRAPTGIANAVPDRQAIREEATTSTAAPPPAPPSVPPSAPPAATSAPPTSGMPLFYPNSHSPQQMLPAQSIKTEAGILPHLPSAGRPMMAQPPAIGHMPSLPPLLPNAVFGGVSNGEALWGPPPRNTGSPEESGEAGQAAHHGTGGANNVMADIDWNVIDALFPVDPQTGEANLTAFADPSVGMGWPPGSTF